jgi:hypothetical protein
LLAASSYLGAVRVKLGQHSSQVGAARRYFCAGSVALDQAAQALRRIRQISERGTHPANRIREGFQAGTQDSYGLGVTVTRGGHAATASAWPSGNRS